MRIRTTSLDELNRWTFAFQKSVALVLTQLISDDENSNNLLHSSLDRENVGEDRAGSSTVDEFGRRTRVPNAMVRLNTTRSNNMYHNGRMFSDTVDTDHVNTSYQ